MADDTNTSFPLLFDDDQPGLLSEGFTGLEELPPPLEPEAEEEEDYTIIGNLERIPDSDISKRSKKDLSALSFEERVAHLRHAVLANPLHREALYKILKYCCDRHILSDTESYIATLPEFDATGQSPYHLLMIGVRGGGIDRYELDAEGDVILPEHKEGLTDDEIDDLIVDFAFETNEYGQELVERMSPRRRLLELFQVTPEFYDSFIEVLEFLSDKRTLAEVDRLFRGRDILKFGREPGDPLIQPSVFIDKLEKAGGIYWENGWIISREAQEVLTTLKERREGGQEEAEGSTETTIES